MNVLITGGSGFIGDRLVNRLLEAGHFVSIFTRRVRERPDRNVGQFYWNHQGVPPHEPFRDVDVVVHLAGEPVAQRWTPAVKAEIRRSRVEGTRFLVEGIRRLSRRPRALVAASAIGYYGERGEETLTESSMPGRGFLPGVCVEWEHEADQAADLGLRVAKLRIGVVLGKGGGALEKMLPPFKLGAGGVVGDGKQWMSWIHVDDLVSLLMLAIESSAMEGPLNAVAPHPVRNEEFTKVLAAALHRPAVFAVPAFALKVMYGEMAEVVLGSQKVLPKAPEQYGFQWKYPQLSGALAEIVG